MREVPGLGTYEDCIGQAETIDLSSNCRMAVLNIDQLIRAKDVAGSVKDRAVAETLRAAQATRNLRELEKKG